MKKLQNEILLIIFVVGIIIITGMGLFFINMSNQFNMFVSSLKDITPQEIDYVINGQIYQTKILILGTILVFSCIVFVIRIFITDNIIKPINKMIDNAQKITNGESVELVEILKNIVKTNWTN